MKQPDSQLIPDPETGKPLYGVGAGTVGAFLEAYYPEAQKLIRIASGYFRLAGYKIGRSYLPDPHRIQFHILVGPGEGGYSQLSVREEIEKELANGEGVYYPIVKEIVRRMEKGEFIIRDAREMKLPYHCKFYICDQTVLCHGSGNYTGYGLLHQHEQASATRDSVAIKAFSDWFDEASNTATDLVEPLLKVLRDWLNLVPPFHAYLKILAALDILFDLDTKPGLVRPVYYQKRVIARAIEHIKEHRAAVIIAATGLGKTIIGSELVYQLMRHEIGHKVILIAPPGVHVDWQKHLSVRGFPVEPVSTDLLFRNSSNRRYHKAYKMDQLLREADAQTTILIDEAHAYRNQLKAYWQKHIKKREKARGSVAVDRIRPVVNDQKATIVLLTATPYGTNPKNTESLLEFLPNSPINQDMSEWSRRKAPTLDDFTKFPFVTSLGLQQVLKLARDRGDIDNGRVFVQFDKQRRYLPETVHLRRVNYTLPFFDHLREAFDKRLFSQEKLSYPDGYIEEKDGYGTRVVDTTDSQFITAWLGSPLAVAECITKNLFTLSLQDKQAQVSPTPLFPNYRPSANGHSKTTFPAKEDQEKRGYQLDMKIGWSQRFEGLNSLKKKLARMSRDDKANKLLDLLEIHVVKGGDKAILFVERHATAIYIDNFLRQYGGAKLRVGCMVHVSEAGYSLREPKYRNDLLDEFSPNSRDVEPKPTDPLNVLICTDANGIGVNLQDANVIVNYDPADSADILFQRAGRIIRFTDNPHREIYLYTFKPTVDHPLPSKACNKIEAVYENMQKHHNRSKKTFGLSILPESDETIIDLNNPDQEAEFIGSFHLATDSSLGDPLFHHTAIYEQHRDLISTIRDGFYSSMVYKEKEPRVVVLLKESTKKPDILLYNLATNVFESTENPVSILKLVACKPTQDNAPVSVGKVERATQRAVDLWRKQRSIAEETTTIFGLYLMPKSKDPFSTELLRDFIQFMKKHKTKEEEKRIGK